MTADSLGQSPFQIPRRIWGRTGLSVPVISFGTQGFGNNFGDVSNEQAVLLIRRAIDLGINHFDCSLCYGDSIHKLALALKKIPRESLIISGRVCLHQRRSHLQTSLTVVSSANEIVRDVEHQLSLLGIDYYDALLAHDPPDIDPTLTPNGVLAGMLECKKRQLTRWIGYGMEPHHFHMKVLRTGDVDVMLHFNDYHLLRRSAATPGGILEEASKRGVGIMTGWSILRGLLTDANLDEAVQRGGFNDPIDIERARHLRIWCRDHHISLLTLAIQFCLRESRTHTLPIGSQSIQELEQNATAAVQLLPETIWEALNEWSKDPLS